MSFRTERSGVEESFIFKKIPPLAPSSLGRDDKDCLRSNFKEGFI
ncbi:MAG: hypothetical protein V1655_04080 [bacterium]